MADDTRVSVILPHLNQPEILARTVEALEAQDFPRDRFEIIVVDNGSNDAALAELHALGARRGLRIDAESEPGPGPARNRGVAIAHHDRLAFIDADCVPDTQWLSAAMRCLDARPDGAIGGDVRILLERPGQFTVLEAYESVFAYRQKEYIERQGFSGTGNLAMTRATYDRVGPFRGLDVAEDREWGQRATALGIGIHYCPGMIVYHPARRTFEELRAKWRRHVFHDYTQHLDRGGSRPAWIVRAGLVLGSILVHCVRIARSERIQGIGARLKAAKCLAAIRGFRALYMLRLAFSGDVDRAQGPVWNR